jgi:glycolate oxidase FAD binding subunit
LRLAGKTRESQPTHDVWQARQALWNGSSPAVVAKLSVLPSQIARVTELTDKLMRPNGPWQWVAQAIGVGLLRLEAAPGALAEAIGALRAELGRIGGSLVVLDCPLEVKTRADVWGYNGDALGLTARVKQQFDPAGTLNPGRFVGGI